MRKTCIFLGFILFISAISALLVYSQEVTEDDGTRRIFDLKKAYTFKQEEMVISEGDMFCSYIIAKSMDQSLLIIGAEQEDLKMKRYTDGHRMFLNKGSNVGVYEGSVFLILAKGDKIKNPFTGDNLGTYYQRKGLAEVICVYEERSLAVLKKCCHPIEMGDILIPYKPLETVFMRKLDYSRCRLPENLEHGTVISSHVFMELTRENPGKFDYITIDSGKGRVERGDWLIFYKKIRIDLPPIVVGTGIVVHADMTNSTAKIIQCTYALEPGMKYAIFPLDDVKEELGIGEGTSLSEDGDKPGEKGEDGRKMLPLPADNSVEVDILFKINESKVDDSHADAFEQIKAFITTRSEYRIILRGYACGIGGLEYNLSLSKKRVENVKAFLVKDLAVPENLIESYFYGEKEAPFDNSSEQQRKLNRRVSIEVVGK